MSTLESLHCTRKLTESELGQLRAALTHELLKSSTLPQSEQDENIADLLDFVLAMVGNAKSAQYIVDELVSMEMEECNAEKAKNVGTIIANFIQEMETPSVVTDKIEAEHETSNIENETTESSGDTNEPIETESSPSTEKSTILVSFIPVSFFQMLC